MSGRRILVVGAHCDDETFGAGGLIAHVKARGGYVCVMAMTHVQETREELDEACRVLGVDSIIPLGLPALTLQNYIPVMADALRNCAFNQQIEEVYTHSLGDTHQDHKAVAAATMIACGPGSRVRLVASYEAPLSSIRAEAFSPNAYVGIEIERKLEAVARYKSQIMDAPHQRSFESVRALARVRGMQSGCEYAEGFEILRVTL